MYEKEFIKFIKAVYGLDKFEANSEVQFGDEIICGWYICGYDTLEELENVYSDDKILDYYKQQC